MRRRLVLQMQALEFFNEMRAARRWWSAISQLIRYEYDKRGGHWSTIPLFTFSMLSGVALSRMTAWAHEITLETFQGVQSVNASGDSSDVFFWFQDNKQ